MKRARLKILHTMCSWIFMWYFCKGKATGTENQSVVTKDRGWAERLTAEGYGGILEKMKLFCILTTETAAQIYMFINTPWPTHTGWLLPYVNYTLILKRWSQSWNLSSSRLCKWPWHHIWSQPFLKGQKLLLSPSIAERSPQSHWK